MGHARAQYNQALALARWPARDFRGTPNLPTFSEALINAPPMADISADSRDRCSDLAWCEIGELDECATRLSRSSDALHQQLPTGHVTLGTYETEAAQLAIARRQPHVAQEHLRSALQIFGAARERNPNELRALAMQTELDPDRLQPAVTGVYDDLSGRPANNINSRGLP